MRPRQLLLIGICLQVFIFTHSAHAQGKFVHQIGLTSENDNYAFTYTDRYYTNGIMLRYTRGRRLPAGSAQRLFTAELGQQIFTPYKFNLAYRRYMDRPFTGFLYFKAGQTRFLQKGAVLQFSALAGVIGEKAFGKEVQCWHHQNFSLKTPHGWQTQLKTGVGLNLETRITYPLVSLGTPRFGLKLHGSGQAQAGNLFIQAGSGMLLRLGAVQDAQMSTAFDARVHAPAKSREWYLYYEPQLSAHWYNATLQGVMGQKVHNLYTTTPRPFIFQQRVGFVFAPNRWVSQVAFSHKTKEAVHQRSNENWGTVSLAYRW